MKRWRGKGNEIENEGKERNRREMIRWRGEGRKDKKRNIKMERKGREKENNEKMER